MRLRLLITSLFAVSFVGALDHTIVSASLTTIAGELGALELMVWIVVGYTLASTVLLPVLGRLGDMLGPRAVFLTALAAFTLASLFCGLASEMSYLIAGRVVQGMSAAGLQLMSQTLVAHIAPPRERPKLLSIVGSAFPAAILIGPLAGALITEAWGWPWVFWINVPVGVIAFALSLIAIPLVAPAPGRHFDAAGATTFASAMVALTLGVHWLADDAMLGVSLSCFGLSALSFVAFILAELRTSSPLIPLRLFTSRPVISGMVLSAVVGVGLFSVTSYVPSYVQMGYQAPLTVSGVVSIASVFGMLVGNLGSGWIVSATGRYKALPVSGALAAAAGMTFMGLLPAGAPLWLPITALTVVGLGTGTFMSLSLAIVQNAIPVSASGSMTAAVNLTNQVGSTIGATAIGVAIGAGITARSREFSNLTPELLAEMAPSARDAASLAYVQVFAPVFFVLALVFVAGVVAALLLPRGRLASEHTTLTETPQTAWRERRS